MMRYLSDKSKIGENTQIGFFTVVEDEVTIGKNCIIGHHVVIHQGSKIGDNVRIDDHAVIGKAPLRSVNSIFQEKESLPPAVIGDGCLIGAGAVIYCGCKLVESVLVADLATVRENVTVGAKTIIGRGVAVENYCRIGSNCKLETNAYITAYSVLEDQVFIAPGVVTSNDNFAGRSQERFKHFKGVTVKKGGRIAAQATILPGKTINAEALVAAGSVVTKDVPEGKIVKGNPAREMNTVPEEQLLKNQ